MLKYHKIPFTSSVMGWMGWCLFKGKLKTWLSPPALYSILLNHILSSRTSKPLIMRFFSRHHLIALGVAVDILGCTGTVSQRAAVLHKLILLAQALKEHAHNLYSFSAMMKALEMPQVVSLWQRYAGKRRQSGSWLIYPALFVFCMQIMRLERTWQALRRNHTETAVLFEKNLKPFMNLLNEGDGE